MARPIITQNEIHSMDMGLESRGPMRPDDVEIPESYNHGIRTWKPTFDRLMNKLIPGQIICTYGSPGAGKTTLLMKVLSLIAEGAPEDVEVDDDEGVDLDAKRVAYISCEEVAPMLALRSKRLGINNVDLIIESKVERVCEYIESGNWDVVVVDSLQALGSLWVQGARRVTDYAGNKLIQAAKKMDITLFVICHATVKGDLKGGTKFLHAADTEFCITLAPSHGPAARCLETKKNRMGPSEVVYLNMLHNGYDFDNEAELAKGDDEDNEDGEESPRAQKKKKDLAALMSMFESNPDGADFDTIRTMCKETGMDIGRAQRLIREMEDMGTVVKEGSRKHNMIWTLEE
jgi:predicted ATP-dependent serine protease